MRQLKLIKRLDQDIFGCTQENRIDEIRHVGKTVGQYIVKKKGYNEEEEQEATFFDKLKSIWSCIFDHVFSPVIGTRLEIIYKIVHLNSETGVNILTLNSLHSILRREVGVLRSNGVFTLTPNEREFLMKPCRHSQDKSHAYPIFSDISQ